MKTKCFLLFCALGFNSITNAQDYKIENNHVLLNVSIKFKQGSTEMLPGSEKALLIIKNYLEEKTAISKLRIECHTDNSGSPVEQQKLSERRAAEVCQQLIKMGIDCQRIIPVGFGSSKPIANLGSSDGNKINERISFVNVALRGKNINGLAVEGGGIIAENPCL